MSERFTIRPADAADLGTIADNLVAGLSTYRSWTPAGWKPPARAEMLLGLAQRFPRDGSWAHVAFEGEQPAGHVSIRPDDQADGGPRPDVALLTQLFVRAEYWGSGLAGALLALGVDGMLERGFAAARLLVVRDHGRAQAFYARNGWRPTGALQRSPELGLEVAEYRLELDG